MSGVFFNDDQKTELENIGKEPIQDIVDYQDDDDDVDIDAIKDDRDVDVVVEDDDVATSIAYLYDHND